MFNWALFWTSAGKATLCVGGVLLGAALLMAAWWALSAVFHRVAFGYWTFNPSQGPTAAGGATLVLLALILAYATNEASQRPLPVSYAPAEATR
jgi:hypothetical protein